MKKIVTFGEIMLRLAPNGYNRFFQDDQLQATFGGGEANVAVSLANYGMRAAFVTRLPSHAIGQGAVNALRALGVRRVIMLTGDQETAARAVCERLGIDTFRAQVLPADKASLIEGYKEGGSRLIMVGDGVNDSPALAAADVSVAMRDASDLAREVADITLLSSDLRELAALRRLSQRMLERINRNYRSILTINTSLLALGIFGILPPTTTALLHNASTMAISAASMRPYLPAPGGRGAQGKEPGNETA